MADTGFKSPTTNNTGQSPSANWNNITNVYTSNDTYATTNSPDGSEDLEMALTKDSVTYHSKPFVTFPTTETTLTFGGPSDLWGTTWSPSDFNDPDFFVNLGNGISQGFFDNNLGGFSISIPSGSTIDGIEVAVECYQDTGMFSSEQFVDHVQVKVYYTEPLNTFRQKIIQVL